MAALVRDFKHNYGGWIGMAILRNDTVQNVGHRAWGTLGDFRKFILRGNVVDLAVGIMIGAAFSAVVTALVNDIITPLIPVGATSLNNLKTTVPYTHGVINWGAFIIAVISFLILAAVIFFFVIRPVNALTERFASKHPAAEPTTRECPYCLSTIPLKAMRCAYCTAQLPPDPQVAAATGQRV
jgi:large conductance mechanosensitive channel